MAIPLRNLAIPAAAGLATMGIVGAQGGDPLETLGAGAAGALGAYGGMRLAGKYASGEARRVQNVMAQMESDAAEYRASKGYDKPPAAGQTRTYSADERNLDNEMNAYRRVANNLNEQNIRRGAMGVLVPVSAGAAALGGMAAGRAIGAVGEMLGIDPEAPGSSNTANSRLNMQSYMASQAMGGSLLPYAMGVGT